MGTQPKDRQHRGMRDRIVNDQNGYGYKRWPPPPTRRQVNSPRSSRADFFWWAQGYPAASIDTSDPSCSTGRPGILGRAGLLFLNGTGQP